MEPTRIFDILEKIQNEFPNRSDVLCSKEQGKWVKYSINEYINYSNLLSYALLHSGINPGDKVATISNNRPEWNFIDMGMCQAGIIHVPIYPTISGEELKYILTHSEAKMLFVSDKYLYNKIKPIAEQIPEIKAIYTFNPIDGAKNWRELLDIGQKADEPLIRGRLKNIKDSIKGTDLFTIIYTSGTTGVPKGVMLSHENMLYQIRCLKQVVDINHNDVSLSFLPICHVLERVVNYTYQYLFVKIYYAEGFERIAENIKEVQPTVFCTVPRLIERVYDKIIQKGKMLEGVKRNIFFWAVELGNKYEIKGKSLVYAAQHAMADSLVFSQWRKGLGGRLKFIISGGAALQPRLTKIFWAAGIPIHEGYGLTETAPIICFNNRNIDDVKIGTVGPRIGKEQQIKIAPDGEILFKGPNLMLGYYKNPELTAEVIDGEGWFHTGDIGVIEDNKFLKITDRKKEIFKLSTGKYIAPQVIENILNESFFIEQIMVIGENEKFPGALIVPNFEFLHNWCARKKIIFHSNEDLIKLPEVVERFKKEILTYNKRLGSTEQIKVFRLLQEDWSSATGELSATLKKRRRFILDKYKDKVEDMYFRKGNKTDDTEE